MTGVWVLLQERTAAARLCRRTTGARRLCLVSAVRSESDYFELIDEVDFVPSQPRAGAQEPEQP